MPYGQRLAIQRLVDNNDAAGKHAVSFLCKHDVEDCNEDIDAAKAIVKQFYWKKKWYNDGISTLKQKSDKFLAWVQDLHN